MCCLCDMNSFPLSSQQCCVLALMSHCFPCCHMHAGYQFYTTPLESRNTQRYFYRPAESVWGKSCRIRQTRAPDNFLPICLSKNERKGSSPHSYRRISLVIRMRPVAQIPTNYQITSVWSSLGLRSQCCRNTLSSQCKLTFCRKGRKVFCLNSVSK